MSGSSGKMGGAEMKDGFRESLLNKVKVTDKFWQGYQELVMDTVIQQDWKKANFMAWFFRTVMLRNGWKA